MWQSEERRRRPRSRNAQLSNPHLRCSLLSTFNAIAAQSQGLGAQRSQHSRRAAACPQQILLLAEQQGSGREGGSSRPFDGGAGCTLQQWVARQGPLTQGQCCSVLAQAAGQLRRAHAKGQAHGCLCLQTLLLGPGQDFASSRCSQDDAGAGHVGQMLCCMKPCKIARRPRMSDLQEQLQMPRFR